MFDLIPFQFHTTTVSAITDDHGIPWFIAADVCAALDVKNVSQALDRLDTDEKSSICLNDGTPGTPITLIISEHGLYRLALSSRKKVAREFQRWVTHDVLPAIRKTGSYGSSTTKGDMLVQMAEAYREQERRLLTLEAAQREEQHARLAQQDLVIASQAKAIEALNASVRAETKADMALDEAHRMTIEEFVVKNGLLRQFPSTEWTRMATWLGQFCQQWGLSMVPVPVMGKPWPTEKAYPWQALAALQRYECQKARQIALVPTPGETGA